MQLAGNHIRVMSEGALVPGQTLSQVSDNLSSPQLVVALRMKIKLHFSFLYGGCKQRAKYMVGEVDRVMEGLGIENEYMEV